MQYKLLKKYVSERGKLTLDMGDFFYYSISGLSLGNYWNIDIALGYPRNGKTTVYYVIIVKGARNECG